ncbi:MAG: c-type cytochrome [Hyphomicrobiales bacterium]|nr:c-type cytochrome [Hyphomicrobiales bacterium]
MSRFSKTALALVAALAAAGPARALDDYGLGRAATPAEINAWNIDVRPDFAGLPKGSGSVDQGQTVWEGKCAACHGTFGESNKVFNPLIGGVTKDDMKTGHVAALMRPDFPDRTTFMKVATISTVFDYIRRAMPWNAPKSLSDDQVYAVLAYMLNLAEIVPDDYVLNDQTIRDVQKILPNRNGMTYDHAMWPSTVFSGKAVKPDTHNAACMKNCKAAPEIASFLPDSALSSHGNIADQNRRFGAIRGQVTGPSGAPAGAKKTMADLAEASGCLQCHRPDSKLIGPAYQEVAQKYKGQQDMAGKLFAKIRAGGGGVWGDVEMPAQTEVKDEDLKALVAWILNGAPTNQ